MIALLGWGLRCELLAPVKPRARAIMSAVFVAMLFQLYPSALMAKGPGEPATVEIMPFARGTTSLVIDQEADRPGDAASRDDAITIAQSALPGLLRLTLLPYRHVSAIAPLAGATSVRGFTALDQADVARPSPYADFIIKGFVTLYEEKISINVTVANRETGNDESLAPVVVQLDRLYDGAQELAFLIANEIGRQTRANFKQRAVTAICIREDASAEARDLEQVVRRGTVAVLHTLIASSRDRRIRWLPALQEECVTESGIRGVAERRKADAVIAVGLKFLTDKRAIENAATRPMFYLYAEDRRIPLPEVAFTPDLRIVNDEELARHLRTLFAVILDPTGDWRISDIPATDETASKYLEMAKQLSASQNKTSNRSAALKDYFFSMAVARAKELSQPQASDARFELARIRIAQGRLEEAGKLLDEATKLLEGPGVNQTDFDVLFMQAELNFQRSRYEESKAQFRQIIRRFPRRTEAYERLATLLTLRNEDNEATRVYLELLEVAPAASIAAYRGLAKLHLTKGDWLAQGTWQQAAAVLEAGAKNLSDAAQRLNLQEELSNLYADAGRAFSVNKKQEIALSFFDKSISVLPSVKAHFYRAGLHYNSGDLAKALSDYSAAVALAESAPTMTPEYIGSKLTVLEILTLQKNYDEAISTADHSAKIFAANPETLGFEPVVRLIGLAAKIAGNRPDFRSDVGDLRTILSYSSREYAFGSYIWKFDAIDEFVMKSNIPEYLKCLFEQVTRSVQDKATEAAFKVDKCGASREPLGRSR